jgi:hypothetical protein
MFRHLSTVKKLQSGLSLSSTNPRSKKNHDHLGISKKAMSNSMLPTTTHRPKHGSEASK